MKNKILVPLLILTMGASYLATPLTAIARTKTDNTRSGGLNSGLISINPLEREAEKGDFKPNYKTPYDTIETLIKAIYRICYSDTSYCEIVISCFDLTSPEFEDRTESDMELCTSYCNSLFKSSSEFQHIKVSLPQIKDREMPLVSILFYFRFEDPDDDTLSQIDFTQIDGKWKIYGSKKMM